MVIYECDACGRRQPGGVLMVSRIGNEQVADTCPDCAAELVRLVRDFLAGKKQARER
jgi:predicted RNA-binding Zn-ribbon protein involved in translation (DUF1610 family)